MKPLIRSQPGWVSTVPRDRAVLPRPRRLAFRIRALAGGEAIPRCPPLRCPHVTPLLPGSPSQEHSQALAVARAKTSVLYRHVDPHLSDSTLHSQFMFLPQSYV